ncbi:gametogenetin [Pyxicephalus adspersus]|uniref:Uncharacterized protein n=1 Tax=Pyxicephalus adspersus TaxID=30357 RepID=A0AAV3AFF8_PYXAD|nr:TPA: hypothetical protein GDO54_017422 [Pyxicephalus adspersus]
MGNIQSQLNTRLAPANPKKEVANKSNTTTNGNTSKTPDIRPINQVLTTQEMPNKHVTKDAELKVKSNTFQNVPTFITAIGSRCLPENENHNEKKVVANMPTENRPQMPIPSKAENHANNAAVGSGLLSELQKQEKKEVVANKYVESPTPKPLPSQKVNPPVNTAIGSGWLPAIQKHITNEVDSYMHTADLAHKPSQGVNLTVNTAMSSCQDKQEVVANIHTAYQPQKPTPHYSVSPTINTAMGLGWLLWGQKHDKKKVVDIMHAEKLSQKHLPNQTINPTLDTAISSERLLENQKHNTKGEVTNMHTDNLPQKTIPSQSVNPIGNTAIGSGWLLGGQIQDKKEIVANMYIANQPQKPITHQVINPTVNATLSPGWLPEIQKQKSQEVVDIVHAENLLQKSLPSQNINRIADTAIGSGGIQEDQKNNTKEVVTKMHTANLLTKTLPRQAVNPTINIAMGSEWLQGGQKQNKNQVGAHMYTANQPQKTTACQAVNPTANTAICAGTLPENQKHNAKQVTLVVNMSTANQPQKSIPVSSVGRKSSENDRGQIFIAKNPPVVQLEDTKPKIFAPPMGTLVTQKIKTDTSQYLKEDQTFHKPQPPCTAQKNTQIPKSSLATATVSYADAVKKTLQQKPSEQHSNVQSVIKQQGTYNMAYSKFGLKAKGTKEKMPAKQELGNRKVANVKYRKCGIIQEASFENAGKKSQGSLPKTNHLAQLRNRGTKDTYSSNYTNLSKKPNNQRITQQKNPNELLQFIGKERVKKRSPGFALKQNVQERPQQNLKVSPRFPIPSISQNYSAGKTQDQKTFSVYGERKVRIGTSLAPVKENSNKIPNLPIEVSVQDPDNKVPIKSLNEGTKMDQEEMTTNTTSTQTVEIQQGLHNSPKTLCPVHSKNKIDNHFIQEHIEDTKVKSPYSNNQLHLEANKIPGYHGLQLPGSPPKNDQLDMQVTDQDIQDGNPKLEKANMDATADNQTTRKFNAFYVDKNCSMRCRCKHHPAKLPPNVTKWLLVTENKLSEPVWITTVESSLVAGTTFVLDNCSTLGPDDCLKK